MEQGIIFNLNSFLVELIMESTELIYPMVIFTCYGFNLAQEEKQLMRHTVRVIPKRICSFMAIFNKFIAFSELLTY